MTMVGLIRQLDADAAAGCVTAAVREGACQLRRQATRGSVTAWVCRAGRDGSAPMPGPGGEEWDSRGTTTVLRWPLSEARRRPPCHGGRSRAARSDASPSAAEAGVAASLLTRRRRRHHHQ